jgi:hypothetical protein
LGEKPVSNPKPVNLRLYGLLHLKEGENSGLNIRVRDFKDQTLVYLNCAINLSKSLQAKNIPFTLITNRKRQVDQIVKDENETLDVIEIPFTTIVPAGARFFAAHFKVDVFRYLSRLNEKYVGFCDLDMVCINDIPHCLSNIIEQNIPLWYDISDQVIPAYGHEVIIRDLELLQQHKSEGKWAGGEFISGTPQFFSVLTDEILRIHDIYLDNLATFHHIGNEPELSAALEILRKRGVYVSAAGTLGIIGRYWNERSLHTQKAFRYYQDCFLLHLPTSADKRFLAKIALENNFDYLQFVKKYNQHRRSLMLNFRRLTRHLKNSLKKLS